MLVWLASYPRSGNTLLRQVLKTCFDLDSCEGLEQVPDQLRDAADVRARHYGNYYLDGDTDEFYRCARTGPGLVLLKTHQLPRDDAKAIYVVRDGRLAVKSFVKFQDSYHPGSSSFDALLAGDHAYGEWTSHYRAWCERRKGELLVLRFEDLVEPGPAVLQQIASYLGVTGPVRPWVSRIATLREQIPAYFGPGDPAWKPDQFWTEPRLRAFYTLHGPLLAQLGYASAEEIAAGAHAPDSDEARLVRFAHDLAARRNVLQTECDARADAIARTKRTCDEQIALLTEACAERDRLLVQMREWSTEQARQARGQLDEVVARLHEVDAHCQKLERRKWWRRLPLAGTLRRLARR